MPCVEVLAIDRTHPSALCQRASKRCDVFKFFLRFLGLLAAAGSFPFPIARLAPAGLLCDPLGQEVADVWYRFFLPFIRLRPRRLSEVLLPWSGFRGELFAPPLLLASFSFDLVVSVVSRALAACGEVVALHASSTHGLPLLGERRHEVGPDVGTR